MLMYKKQLGFLKELCWICVVQVLEEFYNIFGPELKGVTGDPKRIDEVLCRVDSLVLPFEEVSFNPFNICTMSSWKMIMQDFNTTVQVSVGHSGKQKMLKCETKQCNKAAELLICTNNIA